MESIRVFKFDGTLDADQTARRLAPLARGEAARVDLSQIAWARPCGLASLASWIDRTAFRELCPVGINRPVANSPFTYMQNMQFFEQFRVFEQEDFVRHPEEGRFSRMRRIDYQSNTEEAAISIRDAMAIESLAVRGDIFTCLAESLSNIAKHAAAPGYCICQPYLRNTEDERYEIAISDAGVGLFETLKENGNLQPRDDRHAVELACLAGVSKQTGSGQDRTHWGQGLFQIDQIARYSGGFFELWSGTCHRRRKGQHITYAEVPYWKGTTLLLKLPLKGLQSYHDNAAR